MNKPDLTTEEKFAVAMARMELDATLELANERAVSEFVRPCKVAALVIDEDTAREAGYPRTFKGVRVEIDNGAPGIGVRYEQLRY